ncbi:monomethylamine:corrinoid methyltransferase [Infirmifilum lucidum]|uniref:[methylamine--corrinoid protein] Co-methyltransferase n=1 Tax=Infirmifilum lucidum TaxID=2776706 RepID=A0A7L9FIQ8_9CREN|nr:monomethylamine:corrinoid methyltransferase [Infirmifilum lucidum]QOJ78913.1 monomethylamine:corrinoid methyltransferase [Infirmifilum lucidum]
MLTPLDVEGRARLGEYVEQRKFDLEIVTRRVAELEREYGVVFDPECPVPSDPGLGKSVFEAGFVLALEAGLYVVDESRVAKFSEEELKEALQCAPRELVLGRGMDSRVLRVRLPGDTQKPFVFGGLAGTPVPEEYFYITALSYARQPLVDALDHGSMQEVSGVRVRAGAPSEAVAGTRELLYLRRALRDAGRPGMHLLAGESSVSSLGSLAAISTGLLQEGDAHLLPILNELKTDYSQLAKAHVGLERGVLGAALVDPIVGGFARGPAGSAIVSVAEAVLSLVAYRAGYILVHPTHIVKKATSTAECMWVQVAVGLSNTHMRLPLVADIWPAFGLGTTEYLYEIAANTIAATAAGMHLLGPVPANGSAPNGGGLEAEFMAEVGRASAGLSPSSACEIVVELYKKYGEKLRSPDYGRPFWELYDPRTAKPHPSWVEAVHSALRELSELGLRL